MRLWFSLQASASIATNSSELNQQATRWDFEGFSFSRLVEFSFYFGKLSDWNPTQFRMTNESPGTTAVPSTCMRIIAHWLWKALQSRYLLGSIWETECGFGVLRVLLILTLWHGCPSTHTATWFISLPLSSIIQGFQQLHPLGRSSPGFRRDPWFEMPNLDARYLWLPCTKYDDLITNNAEVQVIQI